MRVGILAPDHSRKHGWATYSLNLLGALQRATHAEVMAHYTWAARAKAILAFTSRR
jgi:hypothetical protein